MPSRIALYMAGLYVLPHLKDEKTRLVYLNSISLILFLFSNNNIRLLLLSGIVHSLVHNLFPFLSSEGYQGDQLVLPDILCHFYMMFHGFQEVLKKQDLWSITNKNIFNSFSVIFLIFSFINCLSAAYVDNNKRENILEKSADNNSENKRYLGEKLFSITSISQAISTGYWVAVNLFYSDLSNNNFIYYWMLFISLKVFNWSVYFFNPDYIKYSMINKYVEAVFIIPTWVASLL